MAGVSPHGRRGAGRASRSLARIGAFVAIALLAGGETRAPARADSIGDREAMLGRVGVPDDLRPKIHRAIDTGAVWLARHLDKGDQFRFAGPDRAAADDGSSALVTLALAHAGTPTVLPAARRSAQRLFGLGPARSAASDFAARTHETYGAGLLGLLASDPDLEIPRSRARDLALEFERGQERGSGYWGYRLDAGAYTTSRLRGGARAQVLPVNLSTTQFAALGAHAVGRAGAPVDADVWRRHADGLCERQTPDGSWTYEGQRTAASGYPNGTYMGLAGLCLAEAALQGGVTDAPLLKRVAVARLKGIAALRRDVDALLDALRPRKGGVAPFLDGYSLYALEKACVFAGVEQVEGGSWYVRLAEAVVALQDEGGSWGRDPIRTSFFVLFLARSPERSAPVTTVTDPPRPARPAGPTTPSEPSTPTPR